ncbi:hypothetical protein [Halomonas jincaotanensis]|uniref:hypothetical protein n=1 Tax=Halomonas jincaotanensis TaxID=2810616 RepID=UPI001BD2EE48|nr:hypothetical protein [Halomonas jincaotanensis]
MEAEDKIIVFECRGDARNLNGQLCVQDPHEREAWDFYDPTKKYNCIGFEKVLDGPREVRKENKERPVKTSRTATKSSLAKCRICGADLRPSQARLAKHYREVHNCLVVACEGRITGVLMLDKEINE